MPAAPASYPLRKQFSCLPEEAAIIAAHRGVSKGAKLAENSKSALEALIKKGILVAEVDVAGLKDGTLILYHDGVWEEKSTGKGAVAASTWNDAEKILLKDTEGKLTSDRPVSFADTLALAKDQIYLEIDFKSSAKYEAVIDAVYKAGMAEQVILIAYNEKQGRKLARLAPDMLMSIGPDIDAFKSAGVKRDNMAVWLGKGPYDQGEIDGLNARNIPILAWPNDRYVRQTAGPASLIVSDYAFRHDPIVGLSRAGRAAYEACLSK
jgi:glycerophosphoryl diester phosphodiesterase